MDDLELLVAYKIRKLAIKLHIDARVAVHEEFESQDIDVEAALLAWDSDHPGSHFIQEAFEELHQIALQIRNVRALKGYSRP